MGQVPWLGLCRGGLRAQYSLFQTRHERSNRPTAAIRAEETLGAFVVAEWHVAPLKTDQAMVRNARV